MSQLDLAIAKKFNRDNATEDFGGMTPEEIVNCIKLNINSGVDIYQMYSAYYTHSNREDFYFKDAIKFVNKVVKKYNLKTYTL